MRCFFEWEKLPNSNALRITEVYDTPKELADGRNGIHTTDRNLLMQRVILCTQWRKSLTTKSAMLAHMKLYYTPTEYEETIYLQFLDGYRDRVYALLQSALTQMKKKGLAVVSPTLRECGDYDYELNVEEQVIFEAAEREALRKLNEPTTSSVVRHKRWKAYKEKLDEITNDKLRYTVFKRLDFSLTEKGKKEAASIESVSAIEVSLFVLRMQFHALYDDCGYFGTYCPWSWWEQFALSVLQRHDDKITLEQCRKMLDLRLS